MTGPGSVEQSHLRQPLWLRWLYRTCPSFAFSFLLGNLTTVGFARGVDQTGLSVGNGAAGAGCNWFR